MALPFTGSFVLRSLFVAYALFRVMYPEAFLEASLLLDWKMGALNTAVLISSSFTMALAVNSAQRGLNRKAAFQLLLTIIFACVFLVVKYFEYSHKIHEGFCHQVSILIVRQFMKEHLCSFQSTL